MDQVTVYSIGHLLSNSKDKTKSKSVTDLQTADMFELFDHGGNVFDKASFANPSDAKILFHKSGIKTQRCDELIELQLLKLEEKESQA